MTAEEAQEQHREDTMAIHYSEQDTCKLLLEQLKEMEITLHKIKALNHKCRFDLFDLETSIVGVFTQIETNND